MSGFTFFRRGDCPICSGTTKGCRQSNTTGLIFCRDHSANPNNYIYRGESVQGFGLWQSSTDAETFSQQAREERERKQREFLELQERRRQQQIAKQLPAVERDKAYRRLLGRLTLTKKDQQSLLDRGFTAEQIISDGYKSVNAWLRVGKDFPLNLPGLLPHGAINVPGDGILCPIRDRDGLIVGCQVRLHDGTNGRYRWLTSATKKNPEGATSHLDGELPLGVYEPESSAEFPQIDSIWLSEGTAIKPSITCYRLGVPVIGAASGRFDISAETAKASVDYLSKKYKTKNLTFAIDAGDVLNLCGVPERWQQQFEFFSSLGYQCRVAWWGQLTKDSQDIDELTDYSSIAYINPEYFCTIVKEHKTEKKATRDENEAKCFTTTDWAWQQWRKSRKFTPDVTLNQEKFRFPKIPESDVIVAVKSGLGTGKTEALLEMINQSQSGSMIVGYRNNLLFQTINRASAIGLNIYHLREDDGHFMLPDNNSHQAFCLDSVGHVDGYFTGRDVYIDETVSVLLHAVNGGTLGDNQAKAIKILTRALNVCNRVFLLDGNLANIHADFIAKIAPDKRLIKVLNKRLISSHTIKFIEGIDVNGEIKKRDKSALFKMICSDGVVPWIASDSKEQTKIIDNLLKQFGKFGYVLNAETAGEDWAKEFLVNPDKFINDKKPGYFITSPTAESGVSVTIRGYFTDKFSFFTGVQGTNSQHQQMFRLRDESIPHYVFCPEKSMVRDRSNPGTYSSNRFKEILDERILQSAILASQSVDNSTNVLEIIGQAISRSDDDWWDFACRLGTLDNFEMDNLKDCLIDALKEVGHNVEVIAWTIDEDFKNKEKSAKEEVRQTHAQELFNVVEYDSLEEAKKVSRSSPGKPAIQRRVEKTYLLDRIPGIKETGVWSVNFIYNNYIKDRDFISKQQRFWLLNNVDVSRKRHEVDWYYKATNEDFFSASVKRMSHLVIWALKELNVLQFLHGEWCKDSPEVIDFIEKARQPEIISALRMQPAPARVDGKERIEFISKLMEMIGIKFKKQRQQLIDGVKYRVYAIDTQSMKNPPRLAVLAAVERKFTKWMAEKSQINWVSEPLESGETVASQQPVIEVSERIIEPKQAVQPIESELEPQVKNIWKGLQLRLRQGLEITDKFFNSLYQEICTKLGNVELIPDSEPQFEGKARGWWVWVNSPIGCKSMPCDWLELSSTG